MNQHQIVLTRGDERTIDFSDLADANGLAYDLNDVTAISFTVDGLFTKTLTDFDVDESAGDLLVTIDEEDTEDAPDYRSVYRYEVQLTLTGNVTVTARRGQFIVTPELTAVT